MPAVAALPEIAAALIIVLMLFGIVVVSRAQVAALAMIPFGVGQWIASRVLDVMAAVTNTLAPFAAVATWPLRDAIQVLVVRPWQLADEVGRLGGATYNMGVNLVTWTIPRYFGIATTYAFTLALALQGQMLALHAQALNYTAQAAQLVASYAYALALQNQQLSFALHQVAIAYTLATGAADVAYAQALSAVDRAYTAEVGAVQVQYAQALHAVALAFTEAIGARDVEYTRQAFGEAIGYTDQVSQVDRAYTQAATAAVAAAAAAQTAAVASELAQLTDQPCIRFCGPLGDLGALLQSLEDAGLVALLLGLIAEVRHDPAAVQRVLRQDVVPLGHDALSALGVGA